MGRSALVGVVAMWVNREMGSYVGSRRRWRDLPPRRRAAIAVAAALQLALAAAAWVDLARRPVTAVRGPKWRWGLAIAISWVGPIAYFRCGRIEPLAAAS